jgi:putrescine transport system substrate-binding protein
MRTKYMLCAATIVLAGGAQARAETLRVYNWNQYIAASVVAEFERETGAEVIYDTYDDSDAVEVLLSAGGSGYDIVVVSSWSIGRLIAAHAVQPIEKDRLSNLGNLWDDVMERADALDPGGRYSIPYLWGTTGIGYDANAIKARMPNAPVDSWAMMFDPDIVSRFADCGVTMIDAVEEVLGPALAYLGRDPNSTDPQDVADALAAIERISPYVTGFNSEQIADLSNGKTCLSLSWSGDVLAAADDEAQGVDVVYVAPEEGAPMWLDLFVIPADAREVALAHRFLDFMLRPDVIARCSNVVWYANPNAAATALVAPEIRNNPAVYPPERTMRSLFAPKARSVQDRNELARAWTRIKLGL